MDWISFKFQNLSNFTETEIINYLFELGFNSYQESGKLAEPVKKAIKFNHNNKSEVLFVKEAPYWQGTILQFSGSNATVFYSLAQKGFIGWKIFSSGVLSRFDLYYSRNNETYEKILVREFFENCHRKLKQTNKNVSFEKNTKGLILKIGNRRSSRYSRIYEGNKFLKFEHEMKDNFIRKYHNLLVSNSLKEFEEELSLGFLRYFGKLLPLEYCFTDWLVMQLRLMRQEIVPKRSLYLNSDYIKRESFLSFTDRENLVNLLKFLVYVKNLDYEMDNLGGRWSLRFSIF